MSKSNDDLKIKASDLADLGLCCSGSRVLALSYQLDWTEFVKHGLSCHTLLALNDPIITANVQRFMEQHKHG